ncbi:hypothetical protein DQP58_16970 [Mycobacterium colombiense]|uniref:Uncharacterized protein n=1 Tax=Mycobacterium colombiense TaxID=339268 RepID=A0A329KEI0_9MYCO|nr:hypothetical protein DQP58_16970 [Mycobacterium colombiense]
MALGQVFDARLNALNVWRLVPATEVMLWHCWPVTGRRGLHLRRVKRRWSGALEAQGGRQTPTAPA